MATRKSASKSKKPTASSSNNGHAFAVVVEQLRGDFRILGESLESVREGLAGVSEQRCSSITADS